jgi:IS605 OrfB family transposase
MQKSRALQFYVLGSKDGTAGCQGCVATVSDDGFMLRLRLPDALTEQRDKYLAIPINLTYGDDVLAADALRKVRAINHRFLRDENGWRIFITTTDSAKTISSSSDLSAIGVDMNAYHLAVCETDRFGNPVDRLRIPLFTYGKSTDQAGTVISDVVKTLVDFACDKGTPIAVESLDFDKNKAALEKEDKRYCRMLSSFIYSKILSTIKARAYDNGIERLPVNPAFTSVIGKAKFAHRYDQSTHRLPTVPLRVK